MIFCIGQLIDNTSLDYVPGSYVKTGPGGINGIEIRPGTVKSQLLTIPKVNKHHRFFAAMGD